MRICSPRFRRLACAAVLGIAAAAPAAGAQHGPPACTPNEALQVAVLVDNSTSIYRYEPRFTSQFQSWLGGLWRFLRPVDQLVVFGLHRDPRQEIPLLVDLGVSPQGTRADEDGRVKLQQAVRSLDAHRTSATDLAGALKELREFLTESPPLCPPLVFVITDGALAPYGSITRARARQQFLSAAGALRGEGARVVVLRVGPDGVPAYDPQKSDWAAESMAPTDRRLPASDLLAEAVGSPGQVIAWPVRDRAAAHVFDLRSFAEVRGLSSRANTPPSLRVLDRSVSYLFYPGDVQSSDALVSCSHEPDEHQGVQHYVSRWLNGNSCWHHLVGNVAPLLPGLAAAGVRNFASASQRVLYYRGPDTLHSIGQVVVAEEAKADCSAEDLGWLRYEEPFPAFRGGYPRVQVELSSPNSGASAGSSGWSDTLMLYRVGSTSCFVPDPGEAALLDSVYTATDLQLDMRLLRPDPGPRSSYYVSARVAHLPWQRMRRVRKAPLVPLSRERWYVEGRIQVPATTDLPAVLLGASRRIYLEPREKQCGKVEAGLVCMGFDSILAERPPLRGFLDLRLDDAGPAVPFPFAEVDLLSAYSILVPLPGIVLIVGLLTLAALGWSWWRWAGNGSWRIRLRRLAADPHTYNLLCASSIAALLIVLGWDTREWALRDPDPYLLTEFMRNLAGWAFLAVLGLGWEILLHFSTKGALMGLSAAHESRRGGAGAAETHRFAPERRGAR
jgi:hypothetical protein